MCSTRPLGPLRVKPRNTQDEQMSSALLARTDIGLARPKYYVDQMLWNADTSSVPFARARVKPRSLGFRLNRTAVRQ
jgi:hypothetical protein